MPRHVQALQAALEAKYDPKEEMENGRFELCLPVPDQAADLEPPELPTGGTRHAYRNAEGDLMAYVDRIEMSGGKKRFVTRTVWRDLRSGEYVWRDKAPSDKRPLYRLDSRPPPGSQVLVVEGEKTADAASSRLQLPTVASMGGANAARKTDWSPLFGRNVVVWPDNDPAGRDYAQEVADLALGAGATSARVVSLPTHLPAKWDLADELGEETLTLEQVRAAIETAHPVQSRGGTEGVLTPMSFAKVMGLKVQPRELILRPFLPQKGLAMVHAPRGVGKTHFALACAVAAASGSVAFGSKFVASRKHRVLYVDGEMPIQDIQERLRMFPPTQHRAFEDQIALLSADQYELGLPDLSTPEGQEAFDPVLAGFDLVVFDNLSTLCRSGRENESESWDGMQAFLLKLRRRGTSVLLVHHSGKGGFQRGTSKREDVLDTVIKLELPAGHSPADGARFNLMFEKSRGFYGRDAEPFEARLTDEGWVISDVAEDPDTQRMREMKADGKSYREIGEALGCDKSTVSRRLREG